MPALPVIFNHQDGDTQLVPWTFNGQRGWYRVPTEWALRTDSDGQIWASPNADFSSPEYACKINGDGTLVCQSMIQTLLDGQS